MHFSIGRVGLNTTRLIMISAGFISVYFGFTIVGNRVRQYELDRQNDALEQQIATSKTDLGRLQALQQWMQSDSYVETMARQQGMVRPGERPVVVSAPAAPTRTDWTAGRWWERFLEQPSDSAH